MKTKFQLVLIVLITVQFMLFPLRIEAANTGATAGTNKKTIDTTPIVNQVTYDSSIKVDNLPLSDYENVLFEIHMTPNDAGKIDNYQLTGADPLPKMVYLQVGYGKSIIKVIGRNKKKDCSDEYAYWNARYPLEIINLTNYDKTPDDVKASIRPTTNIHSDNPEIIKLASKITANTKTDMEKARAIHDWVAQNIAYDCMEIAESREDTALTVLHSKKGVCFGYSLLTATLCRAAGIQPRFVWGHSTKPGMGHVWNEIKVDGKWIAVDTTWDAGYVSNNKFIPDFSTKYFDFDANSRNSDYDITRSDRTTSR